MSTPSIAILGLGLIGGSVALAARTVSRETRLFGYDTNPAHRAYALAHGLVDVAVESLDALSFIAPLCVVCTPVHTIVPFVLELARRADMPTLITDAGSVKAPILHAAHPLPAYVSFVPAHPIAGKESTGPEVADGALFRGRKVILTPRDAGHPAVAQTAAFWRSLGGIPEVMEAETHDTVYAYLSHLPQLLAFAYADAFPDYTPSRFTRLCASNRTLWQSIFRMNSTPLTQAAEAFLQELSRPQEGQNAPYAIAAALERTARAKLPQGEKYAGTGYADMTSPLSEAVSDTPGSLDVFMKAVKQLV